MRKVLFFLLCMSYAMSALAQENQKAEKVFNKAVKALEKEKYDDAKSLLTESASMNHIPSEFLLGAIAYDNSDFKYAVEHYTNAAEAGYQPAIEFLSKFYLSNHLGYFADKGKARELILKLTNTDDGQLLYELAECYNNGYCGVQKDKHKAFELYKQSADKGYGLAFIKMAGFYQRGEIVKKNTIQAKLYLIKGQSDPMNSSLNALNILQNSRSTSKEKQKQMDTTKLALERVRASE